MFKTFLGQRLSPCGVNLDSFVLETNIWKSSEISPCLIEAILK